MSAIMLAPEHINVLIWAAIHADRTQGDLYTSTEVDGTPAVSIHSWGTRGNHRYLSAGTETPYGQMLVDANAASCAARYDDDEQGYAYTYTRPQYTEWSPLELLSALDCYEYQACEVSDWSATEAKQFCDILRRRIESRILDTSAGPGAIGPDTLPAVVKERQANMRRRGLL